MTGMAEKMSYLIVHIISIRSVYITWQTGRLGLLRMMVSGNTIGPGMDKVG